MANLLWLSQNDTEFSKHFVLSADIDASATATIDGGKGFLPIGTSSKPFRGFFDGGGHTITGLTINRPDSSYVGLFGYVDGTVGDSGKIQNLTLKDFNIIGDAIVGGLVGRAYSGTFENCHISGIVKGKSEVGGLAGYVRTSLISACSSTAAVTCTVDPAGGLVGRVNENSTIQFSFSNGSVDGGGTSFGSGTGGLVGKLDSSTIKDCYSTASVTATRNPGGLVGISENAPNITNSYSAGPVTSSLNIITPQGLLAMSLGLDANKAVVNNSFWDMEATGANDSVGGFGRPTVQMKSQATFADVGWDFDQVWKMPADSYPRLTWEAQQQAPQPPLSPMGPSEPRWRSGSPTRPPPSKRTATSATGILLPSPS